MKITKHLCNQASIIISFCTKQQFYSTLIQTSEDSPSEEIYSKNRKKKQLIQFEQIFVVTY